MAKAPDEKKTVGEVLPPSNVPHRPGLAPAFGLRAGSDDTLYLNKSVTRPRGQRQGLEGVDDDERFDTVTR